GRPVFVLLMQLPPPTSTLFPYTTLFRSQSSLGQGPKRGLLLARETLHALEEVVGYLDRRLHQLIVCDMATHINGSTGYGRHGRRSEEHTSELQSRGHLVCRLLLEKNNRN